MPQDLLQYLADYEIVVCTACRFAVQPHAFSSHLLRHKIYRDERRRIMNGLSQVKLLHPDRLILPSAHTPPLPELPVFEGLICCALACHHSCISPKRMNQHWCIAHDEHESKKVRSRPALLQTFFRGIKIHYFEVGLPRDVACTNGNGTVEVDTNIKATTDANCMIDIDTATNADVSVNSIAVNHLIVNPTARNSTVPATAKVQGDDVAISHLLLFPPPPMLPELPSSTSSAWPTPRLSPLRALTTPSHEMDMLRYLHHYTITSCLYPRRSLHESFSFWRETIPQEAFVHGFLMNILLAFAATHMAVIASDSDSRRAHHEAALQYQSTSIVSFQTAVKSRSRSNSVALIAYTRFIGLQQFAQHQLEHSSSLQDDTNVLTINYVIELFLMLRGSVELTLSLQNSLPDRSEFLLSKHDIAAMNPDVPLDMLVQPNRANTVYALLDRINGLPSRLADLIPGLAADDPSIARAVATLHRSCTLSYSSDTVEALWNGIDSWPPSVTDDFICMLRNGHPAALVVFSHWCVLIRRIESHYWCLQGRPQRLMDIIEASLDPSLSHLVAIL